jgi:ubiquinone/menaquinone biosynthesis C-methylase UbiE
MNDRERIAYAVGQFGDPAAELARLRQQAELLAISEEAVLSDLGLPNSGRVLDLGCGPGFVARRIQAARPDLKIVGVDLDWGVLNSARTLVLPISADAASLPFLDQHFDGAYSRLVLRHLPDPGAALRELFRVLRQGARVILVDSDDGALLIHPSPEAFMRSWRARQLTFQRHGADPFVGRRLPSLLAAAGFDDIDVRTLVVNSHSIGRQVFAQIVLAPIADAIDADLLGPGEAEAGAISIKRWSEDPEAFGLTTVLAVGGTRR